MATFKDFYMEYYPIVCNYVYRHLGNRQQAEEVAQDVFYLAYVRDILHEHQKPVGWIFATANNFIKRIWSKKKVESLDWDIPFYPSEQLWEILPVSLTQEEVKLAEMFLKKKMTHAEIAKKLGITLAASNSRVRRLKEKIKKLLTQNEKDGVN